MREPTKKLVEAYSLPEDDFGKDDDPGIIAKGCALIRAVFHEEPTSMGEEEWALKFQQACWVEHFRFQNTAKILAALFSATPEG